MKNKELITPLIKAGTVLEISGHTAVVVEITPKGIKCKVDNRIIILDFNKAMLALKTK